MMNNWLTKKPIAHRGYHYGDIKEHSQEAFQLALKYKLTIECDVQMTKDKQIIVFHDNDLLRIFNIEGNIKELSYSQISNLTDNKVLLLTDLLTLVNGQVGLVIEIKTESLNQQITEEVIKIMDNYPYSYALKSFNMFSLLRIQRLRPHTMIGKVLQKDCSVKNIANQFFGLFVTEDFNSISFQKPVKRKRSVPQINWTITSIDDFKKVKTPIFELIPEDELLTIYNPNSYELLDVSDSLE